METLQRKLTDWQVQVALGLELRRQGIITQAQADLAACGRAVDVMLQQWASEAGFPAGQYAVKQVGADMLLLRLEDAEVVEAGE